MGIALGEFIIVNCPKLHWALDPLLAVLPRQTDLLRRSAGTSYLRPELTGSNNPAWSEAPLHKVFTFAYEMRLHTITIKAWTKFYDIPDWQRSNIILYLYNIFNNTVTNYPEFDPLGMRTEMSAKEYLNIADTEE
jgi:hypothetical protein